MWYEDEYDTLTVYKFLGKEEDSLPFMILLFTSIAGLAL